jgi:succinate-acetate transporter protein
VGNATVEHWTTAGPVRGPLSRGETEAFAEQEQATVADSTALGLAGVASATFTLSVVFAGWFGPSGVLVAIPVLLIFGGIGTFLAGMWAHRRGDVLTATAFSVLGSFNAAFALLLGMIATHLMAVAIVSNTVRGMTGIFLLTIAVLTAGLGVAALGRNRMLAAIFFLLALAYLCDGLGIWTQPATWFIAIGNPTVIGVARSGWLLMVGGYAGLVAALLACYEAIALVVNSVSGQERWPVLGARSQSAQPVARRQAATT